MNERLILLLNDSGSFMIRWEFGGASLSVFVGDVAGSSVEATDL